MKKGLIIIVLLLTTSFLFSQVRFGVFTHPHIAWMNSDYKKVTNEKVRFGFDAGLNVDFPLGDNENYYFSTGILLNNTGGTLKYGIDGDTTLAAKVFFSHDDIENDTLQPGAVVTYKLQYIHIPLSLKFKTKEIGYVKYYMQLGVNPQINVAAKGSASQKNIENEKFSKEVKLFSMGYHIGAGIDYSLGGSTAFTTAIIYQAGFLDVTKNEKRKDDKITLNNISIRIGIMF